MLSHCIKVDNVALQREFDRITTSGCKNLKDAFPGSRSDRRSFPALAKKAGLWRLSFKRTFNVMTLPKNRNEYKHQWARANADKIRESRRKFSLKQKEKRSREEQEAALEEYKRKFYAEDLIK